MAALNLQKKRLENYIGIHKESKKKFSKKDSSNQAKTGTGNRHDESNDKRRKMVNYIAVIDWYTREVLGSQISLRGRTEEWKKH
ncbi:MAG: putative transposase [Thermosipho sp. (in: thermotogales)]|jgi:putative transposase|nr:putative integrase, catalytic region [Thermosipho sp. (in: thermotogales)]MDK2838882.1 putative transposase [Thermosipho sp. (in: thermotogales)]MDK2900946.1 putative transposase [Thermosipho sp. (in: thermotogales)]